MKNRDDLINAFNATCTEYPKGLGEVETYEHWLERQLIHRMEVIETYEAKFNDVDLANISQQCELLIGFYNKRNNDLVKSDKPRTIEESANEFIKTNL